MFWILAVLLGLFSVNCAWAQEELPSPFPFAMTTVVVSVDAGDIISDNIFIGAWPMPSKDFTCPDQLSLEAGGRNLTRSPPAGEQHRLSRKVEQLKWAVGTYRLLGDTYYIVKGDSWTSCQHLFFIRNDTGFSRYYRPAKFLAQTE